MAHRDEEIALAAEYALGTLDADERAQVDAMMEADPAYKAVVEGWVRKLAALNDMVGPVEPSPAVWDRIRAAIAPDRAQGDAEKTDTSVAPPLAASPRVIRPMDADGGTTSFDPADTTKRDIDNAATLKETGWREQVRRARATTGLMTAIAAALAAVVVVQMFWPDVLPAALRAPPIIQTVETPAPSRPPPAQYVALLQRDANSPAFILSVDSAAKTFMVRKVGAERPPGKSYELWLVSDKLPSPKSLGLIGDHEFTHGPKMRGDDDDMMMEATYAVTLEPEGGAPGGVATGPIMFTGKLIETVPSEPPAAATPK